VPLPVLGLVARPARAWVRGRGEDGWPVCRERGEDVRKFLHVTARGFAWAAEHDGQAAELLVKHAGPGGPPRTDLDMVRESQAEMGRVRPGHHTAAPL